jgi:anti-anti-sigma factor
VVDGVELDVICGRPTIRGECDLSNATEIAGWLSSFGRGAIEVDLSGVTFFDAAALHALLATVRRNPNMRIVEPSPIVRRVLEITDTYTVLTGGQRV